MQISLGDRHPRCASAAFVAPDANVIGDVELGADSSIWYTAVLRGDLESIRLGAGSNLQDGVVVHVDSMFPASIGAGVSVGHRAVLHGCTVEDDCLIGMGAVVLNGTVIGAGSLVAAGAVVPEGAVIPPRSLVAGVPGKVKRELADADVAKIRANAQIYIGLAREHAQAHRSSR